MIKRDHYYIIAHYTAKARDKAPTHVKGWMADTKNMRWDERVIVSQGVHKRDILAHVILDLTDKKIEHNHFDTAASFDDMFEYFFTNFHKQVMPVMAQLDPTYMQSVVDRLQARADNMKRTMGAK
jgi:hypothetical protein